MCAEFGVLSNRIKLTAPKMSMYRNLLIDSGALACHLLHLPGLSLTSPGVPLKISEEIVPPTHVHTLFWERAECHKNSGFLHSVRLSKRIKWVKENHQHNSVFFSSASLSTHPAFPRSFSDLPYSLQCTGFSCGYPVCTIWGAPSLSIKRISGEIILPELALSNSEPQNCRLGVSLPDCELLLDSLLSFINCWLVADCLAAATCYSACWINFPF